MALTVLDAALSLSLACVFAVSSVPKLRHPKGFAIAVIEYRVLPVEAGKRAAAVIPTMELFVALLLLTGADPGLGSGVSALLLALFTAAIATNVARGREVECHCFGSRSRRKTGKALLAQDATLFLASVLLLVTSSWTVPSAWSPFSLIPGTANHSAVGSAACLIAVLALDRTLRGRGRGGAGPAVAGSGVPAGERAV